MALYEETNFDIRADALDFIDFYIIDRIEGLLQKAELKTELKVLKQHAQKVKFALEKIDISLFKRLRENIRTDTYTPSSFREMLYKYLEHPAGIAGRPDQIGYNNLDVFINGLLSGQAIPEPITEREPEMVFYQKTPARIILELAELAELKQDDVFFDLGSGLGQVVILMNLMSGATAKGVEYEPAYCNYAKECAEQLNLSNVEFINADAHRADYAKGTIFFMYTPFGGNMLQNMLEILKKESQKRTIKIFTYGPCSAAIARHNWLNCINGNADDLYKLYEFRSLIRHL